MQTELHLMAGSGYWDLTSYPIGGDFHRAPRDADLLVVCVGEISPPIRGCDRVGHLENGRRIAFAYRHTTEGARAQLQ
jgi:hypothetical protein